MSYHEKIIASLGMRAHENAVLAHTQSGQTQREHYLKESVKPAAGLNLPSAVASTIVIVRQRSFIMHEITSMGLQWSRLNTASLAEKTQNTRGVNVQYFKLCISDNITTFSAWKVTLHPYHRSLWDFWGEHGHFSSLPRGHTPFMNRDSPRAIFRSETFI